MRMDAFAAKDHSHVSTLAERKRHDDITAPLSPRADHPEVMATIREAKRKPKLPDTFFKTLHTNRATHSTASRAAIRRTGTNCAQIKKEDPGPPAPGVSNVVHLGRVGGLHPTQSGQDGKIGTRREFTARFT